MKSPTRFFVSQETAASGWKNQKRKWLVPFDSRILKYIIHFLFLLNRLFLLLMLIAVNTHAWAITSATLPVPPVGLKTICETFISAPPVNLDITPMQIYGTISKRRETRHAYQYKMFYCYSLSYFYFRIWRYAKSNQWPFSVIYQN